MKKELLAPAGDLEAGYAALYYGADAVYLGLKSFSARATATNFAEAELNEFVGYAHSSGKKVFVAINTLVQEGELSQLLQSLEICRACHIDAVILQDLGVARIIKEKFPEIEMHASTQMAVHNREGALALQKMGFSRVVLARELSLSDIKEIAAIPDLETEAFIHGALCYSYSGLCLFSSLESGRSANRGKCSYPCRAEFCGTEGNSHCFSMKDMALQQDVLKMPVTSLKIEGRKKNALYVAAVTDYYRQILDGKGADVKREERIKQIFSRPWSKFNFNGKDKTVIEPEFVGHRGLLIGKVEQINKGRIVFRTQYPIARYDGIQIDVPGEEKPFGFSLQSMQVLGNKVYETMAKDEVSLQLPPQATKVVKGCKIYLASSTVVKNMYDYTKPKSVEFKQKISIDVEVEIVQDKIIAKSCGVIKDIEGQFGIAEQPERVETAIFEAFSKTGDNEWRLGNLKIVNDDKRFVPVSKLNELRRSLYEIIRPITEKQILPEIDFPVIEMAKKWIVKTDNIDCLSQINIDDLAEVIVLINPNMNFENLKVLPKNKLRLALPAICRNAKRYAEMIARLVSGGYKKWEIANYWSLSLLPENGIDLSFDTSLYMLNSQAVQMAKENGALRVTLSIEDCLLNWKNLADKSPLPLVLPVYQDAPLFTSAVCIRSNSCNVCNREEKLMRLKKDDKEYLALSKECQTILLASNPLCFASEAKNLAIDFYRVDFVYKKYSVEQVKKIFYKLKNFEDVEKCNKGNCRLKQL